MPCHWACPLSSFLLASVLLPHNYLCGELLGCSTLSSCNSAPHFWVSSWVISLNKAGGGLRWGSRVLLPSHLKAVSHQKSPLHRTFNATRVLLHLQLELGCAAFHYSSPPLPPPTPAITLLPHRHILSTSMYKAHISDLQVSEQGWAGGSEAKVVSSVPQEVKRRSQEKISRNSWKQCQGTETSKALEMLPGIAFLA